jgi:hypothetical protein
MPWPSWEAVACTRVFRTLAALTRLATDEDARAEAEAKAVLVAAKGRTVVRSQSGQGAFVHGGDCFVCNCTTRPAGKCGGDHLGQ